ncbi:hypothetical protein EJB05_46516, partial [Eragrostis curvula]
MADFADSASALTLQEPGVSSSEEFIHTTPLEKSIAASPWTLPQNDGALPSASSLGSKIWIRDCPNMYQMFYIRKDLGGSFWMYPDLGGPFQSLKEAEYAINHYLEELQRRARIPHMNLKVLWRSNGFMRIRIIGGDCYGCKNNGSPEMRHPSDTDAYTTGHLDGYLPFGLESSSSDEDESEVRLREMFNDRDDPDYRDKIRRLTPGKGMKRITLRKDNSV